MAAHHGCIQHPSLPLRPVIHTAVRRSHRPRRMAVANTEFYPAFSPPPTRVQVAPLSLREPPALVLDGWRRYLSAIALERLAVTRSCSTTLNSVQRRCTQVENGRSSSPRAIERTYQVSILYRIARRTRWCRRRVVDPTRSDVKSP